MDATKTYFIWYWENHQILYDEYKLCKKSTVSKTWKLCAKQSVTVPGGCTENIDSSSKWGDNGPKRDRCVPGRTGKLGVNRSIPVAPGWTVVAIKVKSINVVIRVLFPISERRNDWVFVELILLIYWKLKKNWYISMLFSTLTARIVSSPSNWIST